MHRYNTPLRYPGGKQKIAPFVAELMELNGLSGSDYVEPYAGGAGVAMELLLGGVAGRIHLNDSCPSLFAFWRSVLDETESLCRMISSASLSIDEWRRQRAIFQRPQDHEPLAVGFSLFYLNRCNRSGIPRGGLIGGLNQVGNWKMDARFTRNELIRRIEVIAARRSDIFVSNRDAEDFIANQIPTLKGSVFVYCDPPYYHKAERLYQNHYKPQDHARIARVIQQQIRGPWIVSYDSAPEIIGYYSRRRSFLYDLQYNASRAYKGTEVFVISDDLVVPDTSSVSCINAALAEIA
ncbi:DNA adenine methylase [Nitrospira sp. BLG_2]|uniref:DNA adenine methylase n=1 Tax=Nitrospira sp. BLG_2 TaxID=3397507 RepID=UPI003B9CE0F4